MGKRMVVLRERSKQQLEAVLFKYEITCIGEAQEQSFLCQICIKIY